MKKPNCQGNFKPVFKSVKHTSKNPHYLSADPNIIAKENVTDEFITLDVKTEDGWVCIQCEKPDCMDEGINPELNLSDESLEVIRLAEAELEKAKTALIDQVGIDPWKGDQADHYKKWHQSMTEATDKIHEEWMAVFMKALREASDHEEFELLKKQYGYYEFQDKLDQEYRKLPTNIYVIPDMENS